MTESHEMKWCGTYKLNVIDKTYTPCPTLEWAEQLEELNDLHMKHVADDYINNNRISTIWLGVDHQWNENAPPLLFETMVFKDGDYGNKIYCSRYSTWQEAEEGHKRAIKWVEDGCVQ